MTIAAAISVVDASRAKATTNNATTTVELAPDGASPASPYESATVAVVVRLVTP